MFRFWQALRHPRLALRLQLIVAFSLLCLLVLGGLAVRENTRLMWNDRVDKLRAIAEQAVSMAADLDRQVQAGKLPHDQALRQWRDTVRPIRYDGGAGYYFAYGMDGITMVLGPTPQVEGTSRYTVTDADGKLWVQEMIAAAGRGGGTVVYRYPKPGSTVAQPKLAYVLPVPGWNLFVATGLYVDDVEAATEAAVLRFGSFAAALVLLCVGVAWWVSRSITRPLAKLRQGMASLARGELQTAVAGTDRRDEVGDMATAMLVFRDGMVEAARLRAAQDEAKQAAAQAHADALARMADSFESRIGHLVSSLSSGAGGLESTAQAMTASADVSNRQAAAVVVAAEQASTGLNTVAAAANQLSASIGEITRQVAHSARIAGRAVEDARRTDTIVQALAEAAEKIGAVVNLITGIAGQTNLLALNATIEAARAGEAGRGFAVVANEVKSLATQTAKATEQIDGQVAQIQVATRDAVAAIRVITTTIEEVSGIAATIAAAVDEQGAATSEIARNVQQTFGANREVTSSIGGVSQAAGETGTAAGLVLNAAADLSRQAEQLSEEVISFVAGVRAA